MPRDQRKATLPFGNRVVRRTTTVEVRSTSAHTSVTDTPKVSVTLPYISPARPEVLAAVDARLAYLRANPPQVE